MKWRITSLFFIFGILCLSLIFNIYRLQIEKGDFYLARAEFLRRLAAFFKRREALSILQTGNNFDKSAFRKNYPVIFAVPTGKLRMLIRRRITRKN